MDQSFTERAYTVAKTVVDCFKFRNKIGPDVTLEDLRECRRERQATFGEIKYHAEICCGGRVIVPYLEAIW